MRYEKKTLKELTVQLVDLMCRLFVSSKIRSTAFGRLRGIKSVPLQDVARVDAAPVTAEVAAGETHVRAGAPAAVRRALPVTSVVLQG